MNCVICGKYYPHYMTIDNKKRSLRNRTKCLDCLPFKQSPYSKRTQEQEREHINEKSRRYYKRQSDKGINVTGRRRKKYKLFLINVIGGGCQFCMYNMCMRNLSFHHIRDKEFQLTEREIRFSLSKILGEINKCILICHNCHGEIHDGLISEDTILIKNKQLIEKTNQLLGKEWNDVLDVS
jgi:hypothetical protein